jgi:tetratricopeptide (TPR) repeat protein
MEVGLDLLRTAAGLLEAAGQTALAARASAGMADLLVDEQRLADALPLLERAYAALDDEEPGEALADVAARLARISYLQGDGPATLAHTDRALAIAEPLGLVEITAEALLARAVGCQLTGRTEEAIALLTHATALADRHGLTAAAVRGYHNAAYLRNTLGQFDAAAELYAASWQVAHRRGDRRWEQFAAAAQATNLYIVGRWDEAVARFEESIAAGARAAYRECFYPMTFIASARGDGAGVARLGALAAEEDPETLPAELQEAMQAVGACVLRAEGRLEEALAAAQSISLPWSGFIGESKMWLLLEAAEAARALGRGDVLEALVAHIDAIPPALLSPWFAAQGLRLRAHLGRGDPHEGLTRAAALLREISTPFYWAQVLLEHGEALRRAGRAADAAPLLEEARGAFERLRAVPWIERAQAAIPAVAA